MADETYYSLLEVPETASAAQIKSAYRRLIQEVHPDRLANASAYWQRQAQEKSKEINEAFAVLSNSTKRGSYDAQLSAYRRSQSRTSSQPDSQPSTSPSASSTQHRSQTSSRSQSSSATGASSSQTGGHASQHRAASTSARSTNVPSQPRARRWALRSNRDRFFWALFGSSAASALTAVFWTQDDVFSFVLAVILWFGIALLYWRPLGRVFLALGLSRSEQQLSVTIGVIVLGMFVGEIANTRTQNLPLPVQPPAQKSLPSENQGTPPMPAPSGEHAEGEVSQMRASAATNLPSHSIIKPISGPPVRLSSGTIDKPLPASPNRLVLSSAATHSSADAHSEVNSTAPALDPQSLEVSGPQGGSPSLSSASASDQASIESACYTARVAQGPAAYHQCLNTQLEELAQYPKAPDLSRLGSVDRSSIESACYTAKVAQGPAAYHRCLNTQLEELAQYPLTPDLSRLSSVDRASIESACYTAKVAQGPAAYHRCLNTQLEELAQYPLAPDLSGLSSVDRTSIESACYTAKVARGPAAYHRCLTSQLSALGGH